MALADTAKLVVDLSLAGNFSRSIGTAQRSLGRFDAALSKTEGRAFRAGQQIGTGIKRGVAIGIAGVGLLGFEVKQGLDSLVALEAQTDATNAAIKSTGGVAGITTAEVRAMAEEFESVNALFGDEVIQSAENMLLAFTNIRKKAFKPTLQAAIDLNAGLGKDPGGLADTARILGIALNDPTKGLGRLSRAGVTFTKEQTERIKGLQKEGKLYEAQAIILKEVQKRFGGRGAAFGGETAKKVAKFNDAIEDLQRTLAAGLLPVVGNIATALDELFRDPQVQKGVAEFGKNLAELFTPERIKSGIGAIKDVLSTIAAVAGPAAAAVGTLVSWFNKIPPDLRNILIGAFAVNKLTGGLVTNILGGLKDLVVGRMNVQAASVTVVGGSGAPGAGAVPGKGGGLGALGKIFLVGEAIGLVAAVNAVRQQISESSTKQAQEVHSSLNTLLANNPTQDQIRTALDGVNQGIADLQSNPLNVLVQGDALNELITMRNQLKAKLTPQDSPNPDREDRNQLHKDLASAALLLRAAQSKGPDEHGRGKAPGASTATQNDIRELAGKLKPLSAIEAAGAKSGDIEKLRADSIAHMQTNTSTLGTKVDTSKAAITNRVGSASASNAAVVAGATRQGSAAIVSAIWAARPVINTYNITRSTTITNRYGGGGTSATRDRPSGPWAGGGD